MSRWLPRPRAERRAAYTAWTGIGAAGAFVVGVLIRDEPLSAGRVLAAALIGGPERDEADNLCLGVRDAIDG